MSVPYRQIRAVYSETTIRVYQAFNDFIADSAIKSGTFVSPPFKKDRMTWIKPSFLWMMYRSGWGEKDENQKRILAIDISRDGFQWALEHSSLSHFQNSFYESKEKWLEIKALSPVRIQWDPERDLLSRPLEHRAIQIGLSKEAVELYVNDWIQNITDVTGTAKEIHSLVQEKRFNLAQALLPNEKKYPLTQKTESRIHVRLKS